MKEKKRFVRATGGLRQLWFKGEIVMDSMFVGKLIAGTIGVATVVAAVVIGVFYAKYSRKQ